MSEAEQATAPREERKRVWKTPANVALCLEADLADPSSRGFVLQIGEAFFHGFVSGRMARSRAGWIVAPMPVFPLPWNWTAI